MLIPLKTLISLIKEEDLLEHFLSSFSCTNDKDIEYFLHNRAIQFENLSKSRTYLICNEDHLKNNSLDNVVIYDYISVAIKILSIPRQTSNRIRKELDGFSAKLHGEPIQDIPCYLIGQLSRNSAVPKSILTGAELLGFAYSIISQSVEAVGGRYIMIECRNEPKLILFYERNLFKPISYIPDNGQPMVQMIRKIM